jgi:hypothetical protein
MNPRLANGSATLLGALAMPGLFLCGCGGGSGGTSGTPATTLSIGIAPASVPAGQTATLTWSSNSASTCQASGAWTGSQSGSGSLEVSQADTGTYTYTLSCYAEASSPATRSATLTVTPPPLTIIGTLSNGVIGTPYNQAIQATGGVAPLNWTVSSGALPHNLSLCPSANNSVTICGMPDTPARASFTIQVTDSAHETATQAFTVSILLQADTLVLSSSGLTFGNQIVGSQSGVLTETLTNTASSDMVISSVAITTSWTSNAGEFTQRSTTCGSSLAPGASCAINVTFTPGQTGLRAAALTISDDTAGSPQSVGLSGVGLSSGPNATLSAASLPLGTQLVGTTSPALTVALTNYGTVALNVPSIATTSSFSETDDCVGSLPSLGSCSISVTFTPNGPGGVTGTLSISDDAAGNPQKVPLSGTGSTNTPPLTGYCVAFCVGKASAQCPQGEPAKHPGGLFCPIPLTAPHSVPVDKGRPCMPGGSTGLAQGFCQTQ